MRRLFVAALLLSACGHDSGSENVGAQIGTTIELRRGGPLPNPANAAEGQSVIFVNKDSITHQIDSSDCPWLSTKAILPGDSVQVPIGSRSFHCTYTGRGGSWTGSIDILGRAPAGGGT